jgi:hypothetical protein
MQRLVIINDHIKLHCPLNLLPQKIFSTYKKGTSKSKHVGKGHKRDTKYKIGEKLLPGHSQKKVYAYTILRLTIFNLFTSTY